MANYSDDFLSPEDERNTARRIHRARSGGYVDHAEDRSRWNQRYHLQPGSNHLSVPTFDRGDTSHGGHRRVRSNDEIRRRRVVSSDSARRSHHDPAPVPVTEYNVREARPMMQEHDLRGEARRYIERARQDSERSGRTSNPAHQRRPSRPKIKVEVHNHASRTDRSTSRRSPNRSPRSAKSPRNHDYSPRSATRSHTTTPPNAQAQTSLLASHLATLQRRLHSIITTCNRHSHISALDPRDLTFSQIAQEVEGCAFQLRVWSRSVNLSGMVRTDRSKREVVEMVGRTLEGMGEKAERLEEACEGVDAGDLRWEGIGDGEDGNGDGEEEWESDGDGDGRNGTIDVTETIGFQIHSLLDSLRSQTNSLARLTRSLQEATPDAREEVEAVEDLVKEMAALFPTKRIFALDDREG
ncbi:hypothetical protein B0J11DRAFT_2807 [Dendryphion nanum]|uniref:Uncharacterized protein n=1 Tax=Dendryphion nanum TaxID=256645 RepID=A0A9P9EID6_9PLEO|nr:hypothetical protein B0J11DRAFT_2807 [Dendryphion nanum]